MKFVFCLPATPPEQPRGVNIKQFWEVYNRARAGLGVLRARLGQTSINAQSKLGRTPINHAAMKGEHAVVMTLAKLAAAENSVKGTPTYLNKRRKHHARRLVTAEFIDPDSNLRPHNHIYGHSNY